MESDSFSLIEDGQHGDLSEYILNPVVFSLKFMWSEKLKIRSKKLCQIFVIASIFWQTFDFLWLFVDESLRNSEIHDVVNLLKNGGSIYYTDFMNSIYYSYGGAIYGQCNTTLWSRFNFTTFDETYHPCCPLVSFMERTTQKFYEQHGNRDYYDLYYEKIQVEPVNNTLYKCIDDTFVDEPVGGYFIFILILTMIGSITSSLSIYGIAKNLAGYQRWHIFWRYLVFPIEILASFIESFTYLPRGFNAYDRARNGYDEYYKKDRDTNFLDHTMMFSDYVRYDYYGDHGKQEVQGLIRTIGRLGPTFVFFGITVFICVFEIIVLQNHYRIVRKSKGSSKALIKDLWRDLVKLFKKDIPQEMDYSVTAEKIEDQEKNDDVDETEIIEKYLTRKKGPVIFNFDYFCGCTTVLRSKGVCLFLIVMNVFSRIYDVLLLTFNYAINSMDDGDYHISMIIWYLWVLIEIIITFFAIYGLIKNYAKLQRWFILWRYMFSGIAIFRACYNCLVFIHGSAAVYGPKLHMDYNRKIVDNNGTKKAEYSVSATHVISNLGRPIVYLSFVVVSCLMEILILQNHYRFLRDRKGKSKGVIIDLVRDLTSCCKR